MTTPKDSMDGLEERFEGRFNMPLGLIDVEPRYAIFKDMEEFLRSELSLALKEERQRVVEMVEVMKLGKRKKKIDYKFLITELEQRDKEVYNQALSDIVSRLEAGE